MGTKKNPWLGLQAYCEGEILYGRSDDILNLSQHVLNNIVTLFYGRSGSGKSSIINAGIVPSARRYGLTPITVRLDHSRDGNTYAAQLRELIKCEGIDISPSRNQNPESLCTLFCDNNFSDKNGEKVRMLIIFDQFEEIFTLQTNREKKIAFFTELASLINKEGQKQGAGENDSSNGNEFHLVFTLREDFLAEFEFFTSAIPMLRQHRYGLRTISDTQAAEIMIMPCPGLVSLDVARLIIEKVTGHTDFELNGKNEIKVEPAVLSLFMSRLYEATGGKPITKEIVEEKSGSIISSFYDDCMSQVPDATTEFLEDELMNENGQRENKSYDIMCQHAGKEYVDMLIGNHLLRVFSYLGELRVEFVHDILCPIVIRRKEQREEIHRQAEEKRLLIEAEKAKQREIEEKTKAEHLRMEAEEKRMRRRNRQLQIISSIIFILLMGSSLTYYFLYEKEHVSYYAGLERLNGWPKGIGAELTASERAKSPLYYRLSHKGYLDHDTEVEILSSNPCLPRTPRMHVFWHEDMEMPDDYKAGQFASKLSKVKRIKFIADSNGQIDREIAMGDNDSILFSLNYSHSETGNEMWAVCKDSNGKGLPVRSNGLDRIRITSDNQGRVTSAIYYNTYGYSVPIYEDVCGYMMTYSGDGKTINRYRLDGFGLLLKDNDCNLVSTTIENGTTVTRYAHASSTGDKSPSETAGPEGYSRIEDKGDTIFYFLVGKKEYTAKRILTRDSHGNVTSDRQAGKPVGNQPAETRYTYDSATGFRSCIEKLDAKGKPYSTETDSIYKKTWKYDGTNVIAEKWFTRNGCVYRHESTKENNKRTTLTDDATKGLYLVEVEESKGDSTVTCYFGRGNKAVNHSINPMDYLTSEEAEDSMEESIELLYHKKVVKTDGKKKMTYYYMLDNDGRLVPHADLIKSETSEWLTDLDNIFCKQQEYDDKGRRVAFVLYDEQMRILKSQLETYRSDGTMDISVMGIDHTPVRCNRWSPIEILYYKMRSYDCLGDNSSSTNNNSVNEWDEASVIFHEGNQMCITLKVTNLLGKYALYYVNGDEDSEPIRAKIPSVFFDQIVTEDKNASNVSVPYMHLLDKKSPLYEKGLKDGDRIVELGRWHIGMPEELLEEEWKRFSDTPTKLKVLRPVPPKLFETIEIKTTRGNRQLEEYHVIRLTKNELADIKSYPDAKEYFR